jgi:hypothetical protein
MANWLASITMMAAGWWCATQSRRAAVLWITAVVLLLVAVYEPGVLERAFAFAASWVWGWTSVGVSEIAKEGGWFAK